LKIYWVVVPEGLGLEQREKKSLIMTTIGRMQIDSACLDTTQSMALGRSCNQQIENCKMDLGSIHHDRQFRNVLTVAAARISFTWLPSVVGDSRTWQFTIVSYRM
jgi:hypothetical protein